MIGTRTQVSEVLSGKRALTLAMVRRVRSGLGISADLLITPTSTKRMPSTLSSRRRRG
jgi:HTH-type transcriptional regulator/antitoxin HigA